MLMAQFQIIRKSICITSRTFFSSVCIVEKTSVKTMKQVCNSFVPESVLSILCTYYVYYFLEMSFLSILCMLSYEEATAILNPILKMRKPRPKVP